MQHPDDNQTRPPSGQRGRPQWRGRGRDDRYNHGDDARAYNPLEEPPILEPPNPLPGFFPYYPQFETSSNETYSQSPPSSRRLSTVPTDEEDDDEAAPSTKPRGSRLYIGNIPYDAEPDFISQLLQSHGFNVLTLDMETKRGHERNMGFCFATLESEAEVQRAITELKGQMIGTRELIFNFATPSPDTGRGKPKKSRRERRSANRRDEASRRSRLGNSSVQSGRSREMESRQWRPGEAAGGSERYSGWNPQSRRGQHGIDWEGRGGHSRERGEGLG